MIHERQAELDALHAATFGTRASDEGRAVARPALVRPQCTDAKVIERARGAKNGAKFAALWSGDTRDHGGDDSAADLALVSMLSFWTQDPDQLDRLFRRSGLMRDKWERATYRQPTIEKALERAEIWEPTIPGPRIVSPAATTTTPPMNGEAEPVPAADSVPAKGGHANQASMLVDLARANNAELFHDTQGEPYARIPVEGHIETWKLSGKPYRHWLAASFYAARGASPGSQAMQDALTTLAGIARFTGDKREVAVRLAGDDTTIYLDLGADDWSVVEVTAAGWRIMPGAEAPVIFRRPKGLGPLPRPIGGGTMADLHPFLNVDDDTFRLVCSWLVAAVRPRGPYPVLSLSGEQGSAKSTTGRMLRALIDPNTVALRAEPREVRDLAIAAGNAWVLAFDNLSRLPDWLSDTLCRVSTGGGFATRALYSDDEEALFDAQRPTILTGITDVVTRSDLLDRTMTVPLPLIRDERRQPEALLWANFEAARPALLGALLDAVSAGLANIGTTTIARPPRMADFALWGAAAAPALGWTADDFLRAYQGNRTAADDIALDAQPIAAPLRAFVEQRGEWTGSASELLKELRALVDDDTRKERGWPKQANTLSGQLRNIAPNLRRVGIHVEHRRAPGGRRELVIRTAGVEHRHDRHDRHTTTVVAPIAPTGSSQNGRASSQQMGGSSQIVPVNDRADAYAGGSGDDGDDGDDPWPDHSNTANDDDDICEVA